MGTDGNEAGAECCASMRENSCWWLSKQLKKARQFHLHIVIAMQTVKHIGRCDIQQ